MQRLNVFLLLMRREALAYFHAPIAYIFLTIFLVLSGVLTFLVSDFFALGESSLSGPFFKWHPYLYALFVPAIGMRVWTEENRQGTLELMLTHPLMLADLVLAKFLAALLPILLTLVLTFSAVLTIEYLGDPDYGTILSGYLGSSLMAAAFLAISCMCSALSRSQVIAFITAAAICMFLVIVGSGRVTNEMINVFPGSRVIVDAVSSIGIGQYFAPFRQGVIELRGFIYFGGLIGLSLFMNYALIFKKQF